MPIIPGSTKLRWRGILTFIVLLSPSGSLRARKFILLLRIANRIVPPPALSIVLLRASRNIIARGRSNTNSARGRSKTNSARGREGRLVNLTHAGKGNKGRNRFSVKNYSKSNGWPYRNGFSKSGWRVKKPFGNVWKESALTKGAVSRQKRSQKALGQKRLQERTLLNQKRAEGLRRIRNQRRLREEQKKNQEKNTYKSNVVTAAFAFRIGMRNLAPPPKISSKIQAAAQRFNKLQTNKQVRRDLRRDGKLGTTRKASKGEGKNKQLSKSANDNKRPGKPANDNKRPGKPANDNKKVANDNKRPGGGGGPGGPPNPRGGVRKAVLNPARWPAWRWSQR